MEQLISKFFADTSLQQRLFPVNTQIVATLQIADEMDSTPQGATTYVKKDICRSKTLINQEVILHLADLVPHVSHILAVPESFDAFSSLGPKPDVDNHS